MGCHVMFQCMYTLGNTEIKLKNLKHLSLLLLLANVSLSTYFYQPDQSLGNSLTEPYSISNTQSASRKGGTSLLRTHSSTPALPRNPSRAPILFSIL